jgi:two-component system sensor histidine kinase ArlS
MSGNDANPGKDYPQLLSLAVHELRSPASVVAGYLRMLQRDDGAPLTERQQKMVSEAEKSCGRIVALISEMSDLAKLDAGTAAVNEQHFDLFAALDEMAGSVHEGQDRGVQLQVAGEAAGAPMKGDAPRIVEAFRAIFRAILREQPASCTVVADRRLILEEGHTSAVVIVTDSSIVQEAYSAPRGQLDDKRGGLGLALPIAARVIRRHGGSVWSPALPKASAIIASLPIRERDR